MQDGQAVEHEALRVLIRAGQSGVEEVEETLLRAGASFPIHVRDVHIQGEEIGTVGDDAAGWIHRGLHRSF